MRRGCPPSRWSATPFLSSHGHVRHDAEHFPPPTSTTVLRGTARHSVYFMQPHKRGFEGQGEPELTRVGSGCAVRRGSWGRAAGRVQTRRSRGRQARSRGPRRRQAQEHPWDEDGDALGRGAPRGPQPRGRARWCGFPYTCWLGWSSGLCRGSEGTLAEESHHRRGAFSEGGILQGSLCGRGWRKLPHRTASKVKAAERSVREL